MAHAYINLVDLSYRQIQELDELSKRAERSRAALIRAAMEEYRAKRLINK